MDSADTWTIVRYWSKVLQSTIHSLLTDLRVMAINSEFQVLSALDVLAKVFKDTCLMTALAVSFLIKIC